MKLDVLLINPGDRKAVYQGLADTYAAIEPPAFAALFARYLMNRGCSVEILDAPALGLTAEQTAEIATRCNPHLAVLAVYGYQPSASTQNMPSAGKIAGLIKQLKPELKLMITGTHPAALPERTLREEAVGFVCCGEGPVTILETVQAIKAGETDFSKVRGLCYWTDGPQSAVQFSPSSPNLTDLDTAYRGGAAWELLPTRLYRAHNWQTGYGPIEERLPYASVLTTFGCPFRCSFCCIQAPFKSGETLLGYKPEVNSYRFRSPQSVIAEIETLVERYGVELLKFHDEMFVLNPKHVFGIANLIKERYGDRLNIWAYARIDTCKEQFLDRLRSAGFRWLGLGIESASGYVRDGADKSFKNEDIISAVKRVKKADINVGGNFIFGLPDDTAETMEETFQMALEIKPELLNLYCAMAYPGSELYRLAKQKGWALPDDPGGPGWIGYSQHSYECLPLRTETVSASEVLYRRDKAFQCYYTDPSTSAYLGSRFGSQSLENIREMLAVRLERKLLEKPAALRSLGEGAYFTEAAY